MALLFAPFLFLVIRRCHFTPHASFIAITFPESQPDPDTKPQPRTVRPWSRESFCWTDGILYTFEPTSAQTGLQTQLTGARRWDGKTERVAWFCKNGLGPTANCECSKQSRE